MVKKFEFDDSDITEEPPLEEDYPPLKMEQDDISDMYEIYEESEDMPKKKKRKMKWKTWHFILIAIIALGLAFVVYLVVTTADNGPVYGNRGDDLIEIVDVDTKLEATKSIMAEKYSEEIVEIRMDIDCRQLKIDIIFVDGMDTKKAQSIAEEATQVFDEQVGREVKDNQIYSDLFGYINNAAQLEVNLYLDSNDSDDFPIFGTKHVQRESFAYTLASVKDEDSKNKAEETLEPKED